MRTYLKGRYPRTPMERWVAWTTADGLPFGLWLRVHAGAEATITKVCPESQVIPGSIEDWKGWTGLRLPESGRCAVLGALEPIELGYVEIYVETNAWMHESMG